MDKTTIRPEIEREAREIYGLLIAGRDDDAEARVMGLGTTKLDVAGALIHLNCRWSASVAKLIEGAFCSSLIIAVLIVPITVSVVVGQKRNWFWFSEDFISYCFVAGVTLLAELLLFGWLNSGIENLPFLKARDRADKVKMVIARDALLSEAETRPEVIAALLDARTAFAAKKDLDETVFDSALKKHLDDAETSPELIAVLLDARCAAAANKDIDEIVFDSDLQKHLKRGVGAIELNAQQKGSMLSALKAATWHLLKGGGDEDHKRSNAKRKIANVEIALTIVEFYHRHADESAIDTLNLIAMCEPVQVSPKWRPVIEEARRVPGVKFVEIQRELKAGKIPANDVAGLNDSPITGTVYNVTRAFQVDQVEDEGLHFFLELSDGSVLAMSGQYIYDIGHREYPGFIKSRFPSSKMIIQNIGHEIFCTGEPLDYEMLPATYWDVWGQEGYAEDMEIFTDVTFDELWRIGDRLP